jgi:hypothetical protein
VTPINCGRFFGSAANPMIVKAPVAIPAPPKPPMARPTIRVVGGMGERADQTAGFEDGHGGDEVRLEGVVLEELAPGGLEAAEGHEVGGAIPCYFVEAVELVCDFWDGGADDGLV